jgi:ABC-type sugar transport system permease subunit
MEHVLKMIKFTKLKRKDQEKAVAIGFLLPAILIIGIFIIFPTLKLFYTSFRSTTLMGGNDVFVGLDNYSAVLKDAEFYRSFRASIYFMVFTVPIQTSIALFMAVQVNKKLKGVGFYRSIYFLPVASSFVVVAYIWTFMLNKNFGLINEFIDFFGYCRINFLGDVKTALPSIIVASTWKSWAFYMMIYLGALKEIPNSLYESADIDGASEIQKFWHITLPSLKRASLFIIMMTTMDSIVRVFVPSFIMTQGGPRGSTDMLVYYIWRKAFRLSQVGCASAIAVLMFVFVLIISILQFKLSKEED